MTLRRPSAIRLGARGRAWAAAAALAALIGGASACGPRKPAGPPVAAAPAYPAFEKPELAEPMPGLPAAVQTRYDEGWALLQAGRPGDAASTFAQVVRSTPAFYPAHAARGYALLAAHEYDHAVESFDAALKTRPGYLPALAGKADALVAAGRNVPAIAALEALVAADPGRTAAKTRLETLRLQVIETLVADARAARQRNDLEAARALWTRALEASPDSADFLRELAQVERQMGRLDDALTHARAVLLLDGNDPATLALVGDLEASRNNLRPALEAYQRAAAGDPRPEYRARIADLERRIELAALPDAYRAIASRVGITRGDLAALLGVRLERLLATARNQPIPLMTDVRGHWAQRWILDAARAGVMEVFPNHTFQPGAPVRRADLARVVSLVYARARAVDPNAAAKWGGRAVEITDVAAGNPVREAADLAVTAGVMGLDPGGAFSATRVVSGAEATAALDRLVALTGGRQ
jgi:tetratricopeptide (TPR) repeat protein